MINIILMDLLVMNFERIKDYDYILSINLP